MLVYRTIEKKVFWEFDSITMQNLSDILPLFCIPTWPSHHVSENQELGDDVFYKTSNLVKERHQNEKRTCERAERKSVQGVQKRLFSFIKYADLSVTLLVAFAVVIAKALKNLDPRPWHRSPTKRWEVAAWIDKYTCYQIEEIVHNASGQRE